MSDISLRLDPMSYISLELLSGTVSRIPSEVRILIQLKTALSPDSDYLDEWTPREERESIASVFKFFWELENIRLNCMDRGCKFEVKLKLDFIGVER